MKTIYIIYAYRNSLNTKLLTAIQLQIELGFGDPKIKVTVNYSCRTMSEELTRHIIYEAIKIRLVNIAKEVII